MNPVIIVRHTCPVCAQPHEVHVVPDRFAQDRQLVRIRGDFRVCERSLVGQTSLMGKITRGMPSRCN